MPTIIKEGPFRFYFYSHEPNEPPHVHIDRDSATAKIWLVTSELAFSRGFRASEIGTVMDLVREHREVLLEAWNDHFEHAGRRQGERCALRGRQHGSQPHGRSLPISALGMVSAPRRSRR
ncbi:MAG: DUF4160 domain-containing protein [Pontixanthobacter sp.]